MMRRVDRRHGADDDRLTRARRRHFLEQPMDRARTIAGAMRFSAPVAVGGKRDRIRIADAAAASARQHDVERMVAADAGQIEHFRSPIAPDARRQKIASMRLGKQRGHDIAPGVEVGGDEHELAETRLTEILREHFRIASAEDRRSTAARTGAAPRIRSQIAFANQSRAASGVERRTGTRHHQPPRARRPPADRPAISPPTASTAMIATSAIVAALGTVVGRFGPANADCSHAE